MNQLNKPIVAIVLFLSVAVFSCKKDSADPITPIPPPNSPILEFITTEGYTYEDTTVEVDTRLEIGLLASVNPSSGSDLHSFTYGRVFNGDSNIVVYSDELPKPEYTWEFPIWSNDSVGEETIFFVLTDIDGLSTELSVNITTTEPEPYSPTFSASSIVVNQGGTDQLDLYITCSSDDYKFLKCIVTYPNGLGVEEFIGAGQIITQTIPYHLSPNFFPYIEGEWSLVVTSQIYSGAYTGEIFETDILLEVSP